MSAVPSSQIVLLGEHPVGRLQLDRDGRTEFRLLESHKSSYPQPVLGQLFLDDPDKVFRSRIQLPAWFSNLLPEGALRELVARKAQAKTVHEYALLHQLRDDLPGNVFLRDEDGGEPALLDDAPVEMLGAEGEGRWKFSLAGVQLKFSAFRGQDRGLTVPASGAGGDWIVKLPDQRFAGVPENEHATMTWARVSGIDVPQCTLIDLSELAGLESLLPQFQERRAFAIKRFDRPSLHERTHIEDFAQVVGQYPAHKYEKVNYEGLARLVLAMTSRLGFEELVRRLVFVVASGNGDAHLKNWSLIYRDGRTAELSPAYDLVSTIHYMPNDLLALNLGKTKRWDEVSLQAFERMAEKLKIDSHSLLHVVKASVEAVRSAWQLHGNDFGFTQAQCQRIDAHMSSSPLLRG